MRLPFALAPALPLWNAVDQPPAAGLDNVPFHQPQPHFNHPHHFNRVPDYLHPDRLAEYGKNFVDPVVAAELAELSADEDIASYVKGRPRVKAANHDFFSEEDIIRNLEYHPRRFTRRLQGLAEDTCNAIGNGLKTISGICDYTIKYPIGMSGKYCTGSGFRFDDCKTKKKFNYPCYKGACQGWTCEPGTHETKIEYLCGAKLKFKEQRVCGDNIRLIADRALKSCSCVGKLEKFLTSPDSKLWKSDSSEEATSRAMTKLIELQSCFADELLEVQNNKDSQLASVYQKYTDGTIVLLPEINQSMYVDIIARATMCIVGGECNSLVLFFQTYLRDSGEAAKNGIIDAFKVSFLPVEQMITVVSRFRQLFKEIKRSDMDALGQCIVKQAGNSQPFQKAKTFLENTQNVLENYDEFDKLIDSGLELARSVDLVIQAVEAAFSSTSPQTVAKNLIKTGPSAITSMLEKLISFPKEIQRFSEGIEKSFAAALEIQSQAQEMFESVDVIFDKSSAAACFSVGPFAEINILVKALHDTVTNFRPTTPEIIPRSVTYNRWSDLKFDVPCTGVEEQCWKLDKYEECFEYPMVYACPTEVELPMPNHHIPYLHIKFNE